MNTRQWRDRPPDLRLAGLQLWVWGRESPDSQDYWDGNWLNIRAQVEASGAFVRVEEACLRNDEIASFAKELEKVHADLAGTASLDCMEPYLSAKVTCDKRGSTEVIIEITPDLVTQAHKFTFSIDQSFLPATLDGCREILERFPIRDTPE